MGSWSGLRRLHVAICAMGLALYVAGFAQQARQPTLPPELRLDTLSYPVHLGGLEAARPEQLRFLGEGWPVGTRLALREADGRSRDVELVPRRDRNYLALSAFSALFFWAMCLFAFTPRLGVPGALYSFWCTLPYGLAIAIGGIYFRGARPWIWSLPGYAHVLCLAALPVVFVGLTTSFPRRHPVRDRLPWLIPLLVAIAAGVAAWQLWNFEAFFRLPEPRLAERVALAGRIADFVMVGQALLGVIFLAQQGRLASEVRERDQVRWLFRGFLIGVTPYVFLRTLPVALGLPAPLPAGVDRLFELAIPIVFLLVVARHQLFQIDVILRRGLIYGTVTTIFLVGWILVLLLVRPIPVGVPSWLSSLLWAALGVGAGLLFRPLRRRVAVVADSRFFQILRASDEVLADLDRSLTAAGTGSELMRIVFRHVSHVLRPRRTLIVVRDGDGVLVEGRRANMEPEEMLGRWRDAGCPELGVVAAPGSTDQPAAEDERFPVAFRERGLVLGATLRSEGEGVGVLLVGPRRTGRHYVRRELGFLQEVGERASVHLERIELARRVGEEQAERRRLDALHRAKSEFLSRISHDLRTPLTSISWSVQNLLDGVVGDLTDDQREYLHEIRHSCGYLNRLVQNLLRLSRLEQGEVEADCERIDVVGVVRQSLTTLGPVARARGVILAPELPAGSATAWADAHLLEEALVNILENAVEFSPPGAAVDVTVENGEDGTRILVRDRGPGLPPGAAATLFERFSQGPSSPWASRKGLGLGLHIANVHLHLMAGGLQAGNHPEGGAVFTCSLRGDAPDPEREA
jgi:signal transduction histidine kinase